MADILMERHNISAIAFNPLLNEQLNGISDKSKQEGSNNPPKIIVEAESLSNINSSDEKAVYTPATIKVSQVISPKRQAELNELCGTVVMSDVFYTSFSSESAGLKSTNAMILALKQLSALIVELTDEISKLIQQIQQLEGILVGVVSNLSKSTAEANESARLYMIQKIRESIKEAADQLRNAASIIFKVTVCFPFLWYLAANSLVQQHAADKLYEMANNTSDNMLAQIPPGIYGIIGLITGGDADKMELGNLIMQVTMLLISIIVTALSLGTAAAPVFILVSLIMIINTVISTLGACLQYIYKNKMSKEKDPKEVKNLENTSTVYFATMANGLVGLVLMLLNETVYKDDISKLKNKDISDIERQKIFEKLNDRNTIAGYVNIGVNVVSMIATAGVSAYNASIEISMSSFRTIALTLMSIIQSLLSMNTSFSGIPDSLFKSNKADSDKFLELLSRTNGVDTEILDKFAEEAKKKGDIRSEVLTHLEKLIQDLVKAIDDAYQLVIQKLP